MKDDLRIAEIPLTTLRTDGQLWQAFYAVQAPWIAAGVTRWLELVRADGPWPALVVAAWRPEQPTQLLGTIVGMWAPVPVTRFDDLLEKRCPDGRIGAERPTDGVWHFIAATVGPGAEGLNLGRRLVGAALAWMAVHAPQARARTLSPAVGLPRLLGLLGDTHAVRESVLHIANAKGQPALEILRLHLGAGATLDAILTRSRRDEARSGCVTLRFAYAVDPAAREAQKARYDAWLERRTAQIATGSARALADPALWQVANAGDADVAAG